MSLTGLILFSFLFYHAIADCGPPGFSKNTPIMKSDIKANGVYPEKFTVSYDCKAEAIVGPYFRQCVNGTWTGFIPRCRKCASG